MNGERTNDERSQSKETSHLIYRRSLFRQSLHLLFDGVPESAQTTPPLTTIAQPIPDIGRRAVSMILDHPDTITRALLDLTFLPRGTTAQPAPA